jgi:glycosyltransferase involved in cell wall biosynthesis
VKILLPTLYDTRGGSTRILLAAAQALRPTHTVTVRAPLPEADEPVRARFPSRPLTGRWRKLAALPRLVRLMAQEIPALRRLRPDVIHVHDEPSLYVYGLAARMVRPRPHLLWHLHADAGRGRLARLRVALADSCILISDHIAPPRGLPATLIRNPLPVLAPLPAPAGDPLAALAVVGAVVARKGQDLAIEALARLRRTHPQARLTLIGPELDAAFAATLRARIAALHLDDAVRFAGERPPETAFAGVGLAVFPSRAEAQPLALAEALARALPIAASDIPAHRAMRAAVAADTLPLAALTPEALATAILTAARTTPPPSLAARTLALHDPARFDDALRARFSSPSPP